MWLCICFHVLEMYFTPQISNWWCYELRRGLDPVLQTSFFSMSGGFRPALKHARGLVWVFPFSLVNQLVFNCQYQSVCARMLYMGRKKHSFVKLCCLPWLWEWDQQVDISWAHPVSASKFPLDIRMGWTETGTNHSLGGIVSARLFSFF